VILKYVFPYCFISLHSWCQHVRTCYYFAPKWSIEMIKSIFISNAALTLMTRVAWTCYSRSRWLKSNVRRLILIYLYIAQLPSGTSFYGTGEASGPLERTGKRVSMPYIFMCSYIATFLSNFLPTITRYLPLVSIRFSLGIQMHGDMGQELLHYINHTHGFCRSSLRERLLVS
jgi:hypothetical protein